MLVCIAKITLCLPEGHSLKAKRQIVNSLSQRLRNKFSIAIAEVEHNDNWQLATLGLSAVSNNGRHLESLFSNIVQEVQAYGRNYHVLNHSHEILSGC